MVLTCHMLTLAGGQFAALQQHHILLADPVEMSQSRTVNNIAADDHNPGMRG